MSSPAGQRLSLSWSRSDCLALSFLTVALGAALAASAFGGVRLGEPPRVELAKVQGVDERIDPNAASVASLRRLPMIGPERAAAIVAYRESAAGSGRRAFETLEDLQAVKGIGPGIVARLAGRVALPSRREGASPSRPGNL